MQRIEAMRETYFPQDGSEDSENKNLSQDQKNRITTCWQRLETPCNILMIGAGIAAFAVMALNSSIATIYAVALIILGFVSWSIAEGICQSKKRSELKSELIILRSALESFEEQVGKLKTVYTYEREQIIAEEERLDLGEDQLIKQYFERLLDLHHRLPKYEKNAFDYPKLGYEADDIKIELRNLSDLWNDKTIAIEDYMKEVNDSHERLVASFDSNINVAQEVLSKIKNVLDRHFYTP